MIMMMMKRNGKRMRLESGSWAHILKVINNIDSGNNRST
jgi:hypothetical protein